MFCSLPSTTCPLSRYRSAQFVRQLDSLDENFAPGACVTHFSKHVSVSFATTSLNTALRFSSCGERSRRQSCDARRRTRTTRARLEELLHVRVVGLHRDAASTDRAIARARCDDETRIRAESRARARRDDAKRRDAARGDRSRRRRATGRRRAFQRAFQLALQLTFQLARADARSRFARSIGRSRVAGARGGVTKTPKSAAR